MAGKFEYLPENLQKELAGNANKMVAQGKGILATDDLPEGIDQRFEGLGIKSGEENRRFYRQLLITSEGIEKYVSGVILFDESVHHKTDDGQTFPQYLLSKGILPGVQADKGLVELRGVKGELTTQGLDDLTKRCRQYYNLGCRFAKWRCAYTIGPETPSSLAIAENTNVMARYAACSQLAGLVPIVEPDVSIEGDHDLERCQKVMETVLAATYKALNDHHVFIEGTVLKTNMVLSGRGCSKKSTPEENARATVQALSRTVPPVMPGVGFLSGGQGEEEASVNLNAINQVEGKKPWALTFCFGRALQASAQKVWAGQAKNVTASQQIFLKRAEANSLASLGLYVPGSIPVVA